MKTIIMGCGRVGSHVSKLLSNSGHEVTVIDPLAENLAILGDDFKGVKIQGVGFDRKVLIEAGIETTDAFAATSKSDNVNIVAARIAHNIFHVPRVVARLYDPRRAEIYRRLGLQTISMISWGSERIYEMLTHSTLDPLISFGTGEVSIVSLVVTSRLQGQFISQVEVPGEISVVGITRDGIAFLPVTGTEIKENDTLHLSVLSSAVDRLEALFEI
ncbi:MAG TPA: TrkA family potassium uptake protein [Leptolinea sp.]